MQYAKGRNSPFPFDLRTAQMFFDGHSIQRNKENARLADLEHYRIFALRGYAVSYRGHGVLVGTTRERGKPEIEIGGFSDERPVPELILRTSEGAVPVYVPKNGKPLFFDTITSNRAYFPVDLVVLVTDDASILDTDHHRAMHQKQAMERALFHLYPSNGFDYRSELAGRVLDTRRLITTPNEPPQNLVARIKKQLKG